MDGFSPETPVEEKDIDRGPLSPSNIQADEMKSPSSEAVQLTPDEEAMRKQMELMQQMSALQEIASAKKNSAEGEVGDSVADRPPIAIPRSIFDQADAGLLAGAQGEAPAPQSLREQMLEPKNSSFQWTDSFFGKMFRKMEEDGLIPNRGDGLFSSIKKAVLLPINVPIRIVRTVGENIAAALKPMPTQTA